MFVRTTDKFKKKIYTNDRDPDELLEALKVREKHVINYDGKEPFNMVLDTVVPTLYAVVIAFLCMAFGIQPSSNAYKGKVFPLEFIKPGAVLMGRDTLVESSDYNLTFPVAGDTTTMMVWDYAKEDLDSIAIIIDGQPMGSDVRLNHSAKVFNVPKGSNVQVIGTFDGGGGITYAVYFPEIKKTIINGLGIGQTNTYGINVSE